MSNQKGSATLFAIIGTVIILGVFAGLGAYKAGLPPFGSGGRTVINDPDAASFPVTLSDSTQVTGVLPQANGGSNASTDFTAGSVIFDDGTRFVQNNSQLFWDNSSFRLGVATVTPGVELSVGGNLLVDATSTVGALFATNTLAVASSSPGSNVQLAVVGHSVLNGNLSVLGVLDSQGTATNTFDGALSATSLYLTQGLRIDVGDLLVDQSIKAATTTVNELQVNGPAATSCIVTTTAEFDFSKSNCYEYSTTTDGTIVTLGHKSNQPGVVWYQHNAASAVAFASSSDQGVTYYFVDGKATTTTEGLGNALDQIVFRGIGTSTTNISVDVIPNKAGMR